MTNQLVRWICLECGAANANDGKQCDSCKALRPRAVVDMILRAREEWTAKRKPLPTIVKLPPILHDLFLRWVDVVEKDPIVGVTDSGLRDKIMGMKVVRGEEGLEDVQLEGPTPTAITEEFLTKPQAEPPK